MTLSVMIWMMTLRSSKCSLIFSRRLGHLGCPSCTKTNNTSKINTQSMLKTSRHNRTKRTLSSCRSNWSRHYSSKSLNTIRIRTRNNPLRVTQDYQDQHLGSDLIKGKMIPIFQNKIQIQEHLTKESMKSKFQKLKEIKLSQHPTNRLLSNSQVNHLKKTLQRLNHPDKERSKKMRIRSCWQFMKLLYGQKLLLTWSP